MGSACYIAHECAQVLSALPALASATTQAACSQHPPPACTHLYIYNFFPVFYFFNHIVYSETRPPCCCISPAAGCLMLLPPRCLLQALIRCGMLKKSGRSCKSKRTVVQTTNKYYNVLCVSLQEDRCIITAFFHPPFCPLLPLLLPTPLTPTPPSSPSPPLLPGHHACE